MRWLSHHISLEEAGYLALHNQRLLKKEERGGKKNLLGVIEQLGYVQIDTISVVERSHNHILWTRLPSFERKHLHALLEKDKKIFEYWSHAAAFLPMRDFRFSLLRMIRYSKHHTAWRKKNRKVISHVIDRITSEGPLQSKDFEHKEKRKAGWWEWKPAKQALEHLFLSGELMVSARNGFQKVYDLSERVLPAGVDTALPSYRELLEHYLLKTVNSFGFASEREANYLLRYDRSVFRNLIGELLEKGRLAGIKIGSLSETYYTSGEKLRALKKRTEPAQVHILSPFDNLVIQRKRLNDIFGFDYMLECYVPAAKRKYGYFCLPVLHGDRFAGRMDAKADRAAGVFVVKSFFPAKGFRPGGVFIEEFKKKLTALSEFTGCREVSIHGTDTLEKHKLVKLIRSRV